VTAIDTSVAEVTVIMAVPETLPDIAVIVDEPVAAGVANPLEPAALLIDATEVEDDSQVTDVFRFCVEPLSYVPVAVNCAVAPRAMLGFVGVTAMDTRVAAVTSSEVDPDIFPDVAVIVVDPADTEVAKPLEPSSLLTAAIFELEEFQVTDVVRSCVVLSENVPVAMNCWLVPLTMLGFVGVIAIDISVAEVTVMVVAPDLLPQLALILALPECVAFVYPGL
jgi:hypothetical protein